MSKQVIVIVNPVAGKRKIMDEVGCLLASLKKQEYKTKLFITQKKGDATRAAAKFGRTRDVIVCCGGDGTLNEVISGLLTIEEKPTLIYYPCGSTNDFATTLGLIKNPQFVCEDIENRQIMDLDIGMFNNEMNFSYIASFGIFVKASYSAPQKLKNTFGHFAYILQGIKEFPTIGKSYHTKITYDDGVIEGDFALVAVTNSTSAGGVLRLPSEQVKLNDGLFEILLIKGIKTPADAVSAIKMLLMKQYDGDKVTLLHTVKAHIECDEGPAWCTDGEFAGNLTSVDTECLKGAVRILI